MCEQRRIFPLRKWNGLSARLDKDTHLSLGSQDCDDLEDLLVTPDIAQDSYSRCDLGMFCPFLPTGLAAEKMAILASEAQPCRHLPFMGQWEVTRKSALFIRCLTACVSGI